MLIHNGLIIITTTIIVVVIILAESRGLRDLSCPTRDWTGAHGSESAGS